MLIKNRSKENLSDIIKKTTSKILLMYEDADRKMNRVLESNRLSIEEIKQNGNGGNGKCKG